MPKACRQEREEAERVKQGVDAGVAKPEAREPLDRGRR